MIDVLIGLALAAAVIGSARLVDFDRDGAFYPTVLVVIALLYVLFGAMDGRRSVVVPEAAAALAFTTVAVLGFKTSAWWLVAGYGLHGGWDVVHDTFVDNAGVPGWWPEFCLGFDCAIAAYLAARVRGARAK